MTKQLRRLASWSSVRADIHERSRRRHLRFVGCNAAGRT
jgi:hypothetical protein